MPPPEEIVDSLPDDGVTRIAIPKPFRDWKSALLFVVIVANLTTTGYLRGKPFFDAASEVNQILLTAACATMTTLPFVALYWLWISRRRRLLRAALEWGDSVTEQEAAERLFRRVSVTDVKRRSQVFCEWLQSRLPNNNTIIINWHDQVAAVHPVRTPFEPRPLEAPDTLPVESDMTDESKSTESAEAVKGVSAAVAGVPSNTGSRRAITFVGITMIAASILWVIAQVARAARQRWMTGLVLPLTMTVLVGIVVWGVSSLLNRDRWFLVPGGVVLRRAKGFGANTQVQMFDRRKSIACIFDLAESGWLLTLQSGDAVAQRKVSLEQLMHFLRTWMSPLTPPVARLVDLE